MTAFLNKMLAITQQLSHSIQKNPQGYANIFIPLSQHSKLQKSLPIQFSGTQSFVKKLADDQRLTGAEFDEFGKLFPHSVDQTAVKKAQEIARNGILPQLDSLVDFVKKNPQQFSLTPQHLENIEPVLLKNFESEFLKTWIQERTSGLAKSAAKEKETENFTPEQLREYLTSSKQQSQSTNSTISLQDHGPRGYNQDKGSTIFVQSEESAFVTALKIEKQLQEAHEKSKDIQGGSTACSLVIKGKDMAVVNYGDSPIVYFSISLMDGKHKINMVRLNALHELNDPYFRNEVLAKNATIFQKDSSSPEMLNGVRALTSSIGDHNLGLGEFCSGNTIFYPNFSEKLNPKSNHFAIVASDGIFHNEAQFYSPRNEYHYKKSLENYFDQNPEKFQILQSANQEEKQKIMLEIAAIISLKARETSTDNITISIVDLTAKQQEGTTQITTTADGHGHEGEKVAELIIKTINSVEEISDKTPGNIPQKTTVRDQPQRLLSQ